jgi:hypothetical protein
LLHVVPFVVPAFTPYNWARPNEEADYRAYVGNNRGDKYLAWCRMHACANAARTVWCEAGGHAACKKECARDGSSTCRAADLSITVPLTFDAAAGAAEHELARQRLPSRRFNRTAPPMLPPANASPHLPTAGPAASKAVLRLTGI